MHDYKIGFIVASVIIGLLFIVLFKQLTNFLKDDSTNPSRPYSLSHTILFFWTVIVIFSVCYIGIVTGAMPVLDKSVLILMGIVVGTSGSTAIIDYAQITNTNIIRHQDKYPCEGWLMDIISDANGPSIHRFQALLFNVLFQCYFINDVIANHQMPVFDSTTLGLLGISSGTYAILKIPENKPVTDLTQNPGVAQPTPPPTNP